MYHSFCLACTRSSKVLNFLCNLAMPNGRCGTPSAVKRWSREELMACSQKALRMKCAILSKVTPAARIRNYTHLSKKDMVNAILSKEYEIKTLVKDMASAGPGSSTTCSKRGKKRRTYPDDDHGLLQRQNRMKVVAELARWMPAEDAINDLRVRG